MVPAKADASSRGATTSWLCKNNMLKVPNAWAQPALSYTRTPHDIPTKHPNRNAKLFLLIPLTEKLILCRGRDQPSVNHIDNTG